MARSERNLDCLCGAPVELSVELSVEARHCSRCGRSMHRPGRLDDVTVHAPLTSAIEMTLGLAA